MRALSFCFLAIYFLPCSPEGIRTLVADLRSQSPRPLDDGALVHFFTAVTAYLSGYCAGVPGLEPRLTEPESAGLPITPYPIRTGVRIPQNLKR